MLVRAIECLASKGDCLSRVISKSAGKTVNRRIVGGDDLIEYWAWGFRSHIMLTFVIRQKVLSFLTD